jgi:hypothetical protein
VNLEEHIAAIILAEEEQSDLLVYCMRDSAMDIFIKRKNEGY